MYTKIDPNHSSEYCICGICENCFDCDCGECLDCRPENDDEDFVVPSYCDFFGDLVFNNGKKYS